MSLPYGIGMSLAQRLGICVLCRHQPMMEGFLCEDCESDLTWLPLPFVIEVEECVIKVQMSSFYTGVVASAIGAFKDNERLDGLPFLVHCLSKLAEHLAGVDEAVILPVPTTNARLVERGFYPVGILAQYLSAMTGFELYHGVSRPVDGMRQRGLGRAERLSNLSGVFVVDELPDVDTVILFDDVSTTGATFVEIAKALLALNPRLTVLAVCLAHGSSDW